MRTAFVLLVLVGAAAAVYVWAPWDQPPPPPVYRTATMERGDVHAAISATGTVEPEEVVDVGAQVAGRIETLGRDPQNSSKSIDYGSLVEEGTILAQIDDDVYRAQVDQAKAAVQRAEADILQQQAKTDQAERDWARAQNSRKSQIISDADLDLARANYEAAQAMIGVTKAALVQAQASLHQSEINLGYTTIRSPVKGVIIDRRVNVGQTVVASLNAPSLFLIAKDLTRLQVWASVNEADIGQIHAGQKVRFTVDAFPGEAFDGSVSQVRLNAAMTQNVVTYTVVVSTDNSNGKLLPYLTANLQFEIASHHDVLLVPNSALRWQPRRGTAPSGADNGDRDTKKPEGASFTRANGAVNRIWIREGEGVKAVEVTLGISDGMQTEVSGEGLAAGMEVIIGELRQERDDSGASPFAPRMFRGGQGGRSP